MSRARLVLVMGLLAAPAWSQWLHDPRPLPTGDAPRHLAAGDLDGDGLADLIVLGGGTAPAAPANLTVLASQIAGTLSQAEFLALMDGTADAGLADVTDDGHLDVVTAIPGLAALSILRGDGTGALLAPLIVPAGGAAQRLCFGDLDLDGSLDVATANGLDQTISLCFGTGGGIAAGQATPVGAPAESLAIATLNADAQPDVLVLLSASGVPQDFSLLPGLGGGALGAAQAALSQSTSDWELCDLDGDGDLDLLACSGDFVRTAGNDGSGVFVPAYSASVGKTLSGVASGDLDLDGLLDVVASSSADDTLRLLCGTGGGGFAAGPLNYVPGAPSDVVTGDFDGDGRPDVGVAAESHDLAYLLTANDARLKFLPATALSVGATARSPSLGDLDGDGDLDVVIATPDPGPIDPGKIVRVFGNGNGTFSGKKFIDSQDAWATALGDVDGDGDLDACVLTEINTCDVFLGDGHGNLALHSSTQTQGQKFQLFLRDFTGDGVLDAMAATFLDATLLPGAGAGDWLPFQVVTLGARDVAVADVDGDRDLDIVGSNHITLETRCWLNDGTGHFALQSMMRTGPQPLGPVVADFDDDGLPDAAVALPGGGFLDGDVALLHGDGAGGFAAPTHQVAPGFGIAAAADFNGDGRPDFVGASSFAGPLGAIDQLHVLVAEDGGLQVASAMTDSAGATGIVVGDLDGDGRNDVVASHPVKGIIAARNASEPHPWHDLGHALTGAPVPAALTPSSWAEAGSPGVLRVSSAAPGAVAALVLAPTSTPTAFKGGVLVPSPPQTAFLLATDSAGHIAMAWAGWPDLPPGDTWYLQVLIKDASAPHGIALTNAVKLVQP